MTRAIVAQREFLDRLAKLRKRNRLAAERIDHRLEDLAEDPFRNTKTDLDPQGPGRIARVGDHRIIYRYCKDCRQIGAYKKVKCVDCAQCADETVKAFTFDDRDIVYDRKRHH